ncbi:MAG TPA: hypothetical protein VF730_13365 [Terracidiphilus sp.]
MARMAWAAMLNPLFRAHLKLNFAGVENCPAVAQEAMGAITKV